MSIAYQSITVVIPALNEEAAIEQVTSELISHLPGAEIVVVDDGSTDRTAELAKASGAVVLSHDRRMGYGAALKTGIRHSTREYVLSCDGDGQHRIEDIQMLINACDGYDMVVGARTAESHIPFLRRPGKLILKWFANFLAGTAIPDLNSGLRIFKRDTIIRYLHLMPKGFSFSTTSTFAMLKSERRFTFIPITAHKRIGKSTVQQWRHGPQTIMLMLRLTVLFEPLKVFLSVALALFITCIGSFVIDIVLSGGGVGDTTVLLAISSLIVFMFGLLCDQVSAMRREKHD